MSTILALLPILCLLTLLIVCKLPAVRASFCTLCLTAAICFIYFRFTLYGAGIASLKGLSLALFVSLIVWGAILLYNIVQAAGALNVISKNINIVIEDRFTQFLLLSWIFASFLQGIAGFGVPVVIVVPILIGMGFDATKTAAAALVGHSWSISFGSMGSSIYAIGMVTTTDIDDITVWMILFGVIGMFMTGLVVCHIYGGFPYVIKGLGIVVAASICMGAVMAGVIFNSMFSLIGLLAGSTGIATVLLLNKIKTSTGGKKELYKSGVNIGEAILPYALIVIFSLLFSFINPAAAIVFNFPGYETLLGHVVNPANAYVTINLLRHPFAIIIMASVVSILVYKKRNVLSPGYMKNIMRLTVKECKSSTYTLVFLLITAVLLMDSGMIQTIANELIRLTGNGYPLVAPFIGVLGAFVTGSNTNSNVIFGSLQETVAFALNLSPAAICAVQSIGGSIGCSIAPTKVALGATASGVQGEEFLIYKKTLPPTLFIALCLGIVSYVLNIYIL